MTLKSMITADVSKVFLNTDDFAESATYTPKDGSERSIAIVVTDRSVNRENPVGVRVNEQVLKTFCKLSTTEGIDNPREHDQLEFDGLKWRYRAVVSRDMAGITIEWTANQDLRPRK